MMLPELYQLRYGHFATPGKPFGSEFRSARVGSDTDFLRVPSGGTKALRRLKPVLLPVVVCVTFTDISQLLPKCHPGGFART